MKTLQASRREAILAVDLYNGSYERRSLEAFIVHMNIAWLYLLHARFTRDHIDYRYRRSPRRLEYVDGDVKLWELSRCLKELWPENDPVRKNLELFVGLRNKIEHRHEDAIAVAVAGHVQALVMNYERDLVEQFGPSQSLADTLRFPVFLTTITDEGIEGLRRLRASLPARTSRFLDEFVRSLDPDVADDPRFEFRVHLIPNIGPKSQADLAVQFVKLEDLTDDGRATLENLGRTGVVITRTKDRLVQNLGNMRPKEVVEAVKKQVPWFNMSCFIKMWKTLQVRPPRGAANPTETDQRYCLFDEAHRDYVYTRAYVGKLIREAQKQSDASGPSPYRPIPSA